MRALGLQKVWIRSPARLRWSSSWQIPGQAIAEVSGCAEKPDDEISAALTVPLGPAGVVVQPHTSVTPTRQLWDAPALPKPAAWLAFSKAPDDNPIDQPASTYDRQDVPATKPGMDAPTSPDSTNPEIDRSDYSAPGTNPDVDHNDPDDYKPSSDDADDLKKRGRTGKSKLPGSGGKHASALAASSQPRRMMWGLSGNAAITPASAAMRLHVLASSNSDEGNVAKDDSAGAVHPHLPGASPDDTTDKSDAKTPTYDPQPDMMTDETLANKPKLPGKHKDGDAVDSDNSVVNQDGPRKEPEDIAPEQAGS